MLRRRFPGARVSQFDGAVDPDVGRSVPCSPEVSHLADDGVDERNAAVADEDVVGDLLARRHLSSFIGALWTSQSRRQVRHAWAVQRGSSDESQLIDSRNDDRAARFPASPPLDEGPRWFGKSWCRCLDRSTDGCRQAGQLVSGGASRRRQFGHQMASCSRPKGDVRRRHGSVPSPSA